MITDTMQKALTDVVESFTYMSDPEQFGQAEAWYIMKEKPYTGDCEDFALTTLYNICNRKVVLMLASIFVGRSKICFTKSPSEGGHAVLRHRGMYTDNWQKEWLTKQDYLDKGYTFHPFLFWWWTSSVKLTLGYIAARKKEKNNG
jgi:hypothetical protein|tara:strand:+ start:4627 stop:5061 length:435 start_codon:yes stop_codon:yes gene_type:complete